MYWKPSETHEISEIIISQIFPMNSSCFQRLDRQPTFKKPSPSSSVSRCTRSATLLPKMAASSARVASVSWRSVVGGGMEKWRGNGGKMMGNNRKMMDTWWPCWKTIFFFSVVNAPKPGIHISLQVTFSKNGTFPDPTHCHHILSLPLSSGVIQHL